MDPINFTPYNSAQVEEPRTLANPFETPTNPKKKKEDIGVLKMNKIIKDNNNGKFI